MAGESGPAPPGRSPHRVARPLDTNEGFFAAYNSVNAYLTTLALELEGPLGEELLRRALAHLQERHPLLRARIVEGALGPEWTTPTEVAAPVLRMVGREAAPSLEQLAEEELDRGYRTEDEPLWRCTFAPGPEGGAHRLLLSTHHAVADGMSGLILVSDLIATCAALARGGPLPPHLPVLPPLDQALGEASPAERARLWIRGKLHRVRERLSGPLELLPLEGAAPAERRRTRVLFQGLAVAGLRARAREERTTVTGALAAALLEATGQTLGPLRRVPLNYPVSMRDRSIRADQIGSFTGNVRTTHALQSGRRFWDVAREANRKLQTALRRGDTQAALRANRGKVIAAREEIRRMAADPGDSGREGALALSSRGRWPDPSAGPFRLRALHPATSNHTLGNGFQVSCGTVGERMFGSLMFVEPLFCEATGRALADRFWSILVRESRSPDAPLRRPTV